MGKKVEKSYNLAVIDIGSPRLDRLGWSLIDVSKNEEYHGKELDELIALTSVFLEARGLLLGLEAPLFVPVRKCLKSITKARKGEGRYPWSGGAGAQVLVINLPIMVYLFKKLKQKISGLKFILEEDNFSGSAREILLFEALVSGSNKGNSHIHDAQIMANYCLEFAMKKELPTNILEYEQETDFFNLAAAALLQSESISSVDTLSKPSPIYKP